MEGGGTVVTSPKEGDSSMEENSETFWSDAPTESGGTGVTAP